jgi:glycosyltransferase involved in cell wall biosynthesis
MIVKNESAIIKDTLQKLTKKMSFDYYVISDTGSTDNTIEIIKDFFKDTPGEIHCDEWKNFGYNRTKALQHAYGKTDYLFVFDADDEIIGDLILPKELDKDEYFLTFGNETLRYRRPCLINNSMVWEYVGVLHEYITTKEQPTQDNLFGDYYIISGRTSSRNNNKNKYIEDSLILKDAYFEAIKSGDFISNRYAFYCANSYRDAGKKEEAIEWYILTIESNGWEDEKYYSCLQLYNLKGHIDGCYYLLQSYRYNPKRVEGIYLLIKHYCSVGLHEIAYSFYSLIKNYYENEYQVDTLSTKLFCNIQDYTFNLAYYMIIVCYNTKDYVTGIKMFEIIFQQKEVTAQLLINNTMFNFQFFQKYATRDTIKMMDNYITFLSNRGITFETELIRKYKPKKKIFIYTGFASSCWNYTYSLSNPIGGSERAVIELSKRLQDYDITIFGDITEETINGIRYINRQNIGDIDCDILIISRYVSFFTLYPTFKAEKIMIMAHDTVLLNNIVGSTLSIEDLLQNQKIDSVVCLTEWHKNNFTKLYPFLTDKIKIINNGITPSLFKNSQKISNSFIYSSCTERGLKRILYIWEVIRSYLPDATLNICSYNNFPRNDFEKEIEQMISTLEGVKHLGKLNQNDLYELMSRSEYWLYPVNFDETSCITAMEMLMSEVICLYYPRGGLVDTMSTYGLHVSEGNEIETILNLTTLQKNKLRTEGKRYAQTCSWDIRALEWEHLLEKNNNIVFFVPPVMRKTTTEYLSHFGEIVDDDYNKPGYENYEIIFVHMIFESKYTKFNYLNTEPLNHEVWLNRILYYNKMYPDMKIYDYSLSNIKILKSNGVTNTEYLKYPYDKKDILFLQSDKLEKPLYDFGIICAPGKPSTLSEDLPPARKKVVESLLSRGYSVNIISGWGNERDIELGKCKTILNIHGELNFVRSMVFEHIRCDRLLHAGYNVLSEESYELDEAFQSSYPNLHIVPYSWFLEDNLEHKLFIKEKYKSLCKTHSDINEHLPTLYRYALECDSVFESGVRGVVSSYAFASAFLEDGNNKRYILNDITECDVNELFFHAKKVMNIDCIWKNNLEIEISETFDLTFIDTLHVYGQLKRELDKYSKITNKYIIMHDTTIFEWEGQCKYLNWNENDVSKETGFPVDEIKRGLWPAIEEFLSENHEWVLHERFTNNNGLTVLKKQYATLVAF